MDLKDEVNDQSLDGVTKNDVSTENTCTNDVTGDATDDVTPTDVTETNDVTDADKKEVSATPDEGDLEQAPNQEANGEQTESEKNIEIENTATTIAQKSETENSEEHTASQISESNIEPKSNGHVSEKQERFFLSFDLEFDPLGLFNGIENNRIRTMKYL